MTNETQNGMRDLGQAQAQEYQPRHEAPQLDDAFLESQAAAADEYRYDQMYKQFMAEYAVERATSGSELGSEKGKRTVADQYQLIAKSLGRQAAAKQYADQLRAQIYYTPVDGVVYQGRHRKVDEPFDAGDEAGLGSGRLQQDSQVPEDPPLYQELVSVLGDPNNPIPPSSQYSAGPEPSASTRDMPNLDIQPEPVPQQLPEPAPPSVRRSHRKRGRATNAWYAAGAAVSSYFTHPEKGHRRQIVATLGMFGVLAAAGWIFGERPNEHIGHDPTLAPPDVSPPPQPQTEQFFDTLQPQGYHGESYEWGALANQSGSAQATPDLLGMIGQARAHGLIVDTWGDPACGTWGIQDVTVQLSDGTYKSYFDTPHKLAILQWYAAK